MNIRIWVKVLQYSEHPGDSLTVTAGGLAPATPINWNLINTWQELRIDGLTAAADTDLVIRAVTRTDMSNYQPTLLLVGAVLVGTPPTELSDRLPLMGYSSNFSSPDFILKSVYPVEDTGVFDDKPWEDTQNRFARLGGLTRPRIAASIRHDIVTEEEGEGETEGEGEPAPEGEGEVELQGYVQFRYGDEGLCCPIKFQDMNFACSEPDCEGYRYWDVGECTRVSMFIPPYLLGSAQRPALRVKVDSSETGSRLIVDDFVLTYVSQALEDAIPSLLHTGNLIENGNFENGEYPFVIQSPTGQTNCARITDVIRDIDDACRGDAAAVFDGQVSTTPMVAYCTADALIGRGQTGTLALYGLNLEYIEEVLLIPEWHATDAFADGNYIRLSGPSEIEYEGDLEKVVYTFRFDSPFNVGVGGNLICTDGRATFEYTAPGLDQASQDTGTCATVIDTLPPVLVVNSPEGVDAAAGWPAIYGTNRVQAVSPGPPFPSSWILTTGATLTPKNAASFSRQDMHVYLNAGSLVGYPYAASSTPIDDLYFSVWAYFVDPSPVDGAGKAYPVTTSGFQAAFYPEPSTEGEPPAPPSPFDRYRGVRWNGSAKTSINLLTLAAVPSLDPPNEMNVTWNVEVPTIPPPGDKYWWARFKFEVSDRANNLLDISKNNAVNIHWQWTTQAEVTSGLNMAEHAPQLTWRLVTPELPGAPPACAPLARFRLYLGDANTGAVTYLGTSPWLQGPLRDTTVFTHEETNVSMPLRQWVDKNKGSRIHLDIIGADETGNVQLDPGPAGTVDDIRSIMQIPEEAIPTWDEEVRDYRNEALDTAVGVRLYHERSNLTPVNDFGGATRVPLPPLCDACYTRVNGNVWFRAMVPAQSGGPVEILWKFYKDGMLSARGVIPGNNPNEQFNAHLQCSVPLMDLLLLDIGTTVATPDALQDFDASTSVPELILGKAALAPEAFLNRHPNVDYCTTPMPDCVVNFGIPDWRLGDEGIPPDFTNNPNAAPARRREVHYLITAQTVINGSLVDTTPATARFSVYPLETEEAVRDEMPVREYSR
ncbi:MAG: hypothetical protein GXY07_13015 [Candidatus Hydrogenedentes bacterium]|nr:hypothetical protein [Candidatus Hydrogenedentota bacterium]